jgi:hypothetical protein
MSHLAGSDYQGFEQGPIRPPSEAGSLLIRVTRNCPWNKCTFCPVYKGARFSRRPVDHVLQDLDAVHRAVEIIQEVARESGNLSTAAPEVARRLETGDRLAWQAAWHWLKHGARHVFLQDADSLVTNPADLLKILRHLQERFPQVERLTSYARAQTIARLGAEPLAAFREAGLDRIHIGLESGADEVLEMVRKGATKAVHLTAGLKVKEAGMELSEYYMPGLGGRALLERHALETADALNRINPHFIRLRTLALPPTVPLHGEYQAGRFEPCSEVLVAQEILLWLEALQGITSTIRSDHILNLLPEIDGVLPRDRERLLGVVRAFLDLDPERQCLYQVGRRLGLLSRLGDLESPQRLAQLREICRTQGVTPANVDRMAADLRQRFI